MAHRTQLYLEDAQYEYLKELTRIQKKSMARIIRDWIEEKRQARNLKNYLDDPLFKICGLFHSGRPDMAEHFDDYLYGGKE